MLLTTLLPTLTTLSALLSITSAAPVEPSLTKRDGHTFVLSVLDVLNTMPGYNNTPIIARNGNFYVGGGPPTTTCPPDHNCPSDPPTVFQCVADNANTTCYLATLSGKQPIYINPYSGSLNYAPSYMYGGLSPAEVPEFEHSGDSFASTQFYDNNAGSFFNQNWFGCASQNTQNPEYAAPWQLYFAISSGAGCDSASAWIELLATDVNGADAYAYAM